MPLDSDHAWGEFTVRLGWRDGDAFRRANDGYYTAYKDGTLDIHDYVRFAIDAVRERGLAEGRRAHERFMAEVIRPAITEGARALVRRHQEAGDTVIIVTATNGFVTRPIAQAFGVEHLIAIDLETDARGEYTGAIAGVPSFREGKVARVEQWLADRGLRWPDLAHSTFYSDSMNDLPLLEKVHEPVATNPDQRLANLAQQRGWRILNLF
jgi:HAD superfamily hydrolase (TIGR01490 family)